MHIVELQRLASDAGVYRANGMNSTGELIRAIQHARGKHQCFMTGQRFTCEAGNCEWKQECQRLVATWLR